MDNFDSNFPWSTSPLGDYSGLYGQTPPTHRPSPQFELFTPTQGQMNQKLAYSNEIPSDADLMSHAPHFPPNPNLSMAMGDHSRQDSMSTEISPTKQENMGLSGSDPYGASSHTQAVDRRWSAGTLQTPPQTSPILGKDFKKPTRPGSSSRLSSKGRQRQHATVKNTTTPAKPPPFSPDPFSGSDYTLPGPATAPAYPQHKLFWDPNCMSSMDVDFMGANPMSFNTTQAEDAMGWIPTSSQSFDEPVMSSGITMPPWESPMSKVQVRRKSSTGGARSKAANAPSQGLRHKSTTSSHSRGSSRTSQAPEHAVNPLLLCSLSSSPTKSAAFSDSTLPRDGQQQKTRQPYQHQLEQLRREREMEIDPQFSSASPSENIRPTSAMAKPVGRPPVRRCMTESSIAPPASRVRPLSMASSRPFPPAKAAGPVVRRASPVKGRKPRSDGIREGTTSSKRTSITFSIDENGRAVTETRLISDGAAMDEDSDSSQGNDDFTTSRNASFTCADEIPRPPKLARFATKSSQSGTDARNPSGRVSLGYSNGSAHASFASEDVDSDTETAIMEEMGGRSQGNARNALREVLGQRSKASLGQPNRAGQAFAKPRIGFNSSAATTTTTTTTPTHHRQYSGYSNASTNISPTTITDPDMSTPSTDRDSQAESSNGESSTRCVCSTQDGGGGGHLMIQWYSQSSEARHTLFPSRFGLTLDLSTATRAPNGFTCNVWASVGKRCRRSTCAYIARATRRSCEAVGYEIRCGDLTRATTWGRRL